MPRSVRLQNKNQIEHGHKMDSNFQITSRIIQRINLRPFLKVLNLSLDLEIAKFFMKKVHSIAISPKVSRNSEY